MTTSTRGNLVSILTHFQAILDTHDESQLSSKELWSVPLRPETFSPYSSGYFNALQSELDERRNMLSVLHTLSKSLEDELPELEAQVCTTALDHGLLSLPDEVLSMILECTVQLIKDTLILSLVCPRFKSFIFSSPRIWAGLELNLRMTLRQIDTIVEHSRGLLVEAIIYSPFSWDAETSRIISRIISSHGSSLKKLTIRAAEDFYTQIKSIHLPHLRVLILCKWRKMNDEAHIDISKNHYYASWTMPQLHSLKADFIPLPILARNLRRCKLNFFGRWLSRCSGLLDFLASASLLEDLRIDFVDTVAWPETRTEPVALPNLKSMTLRVVDDWSLYLRHDLFNKLIFDNLTHLTVDFDVTDEFKSQLVGTRELEDKPEYTNGEDILVNFVSRQRSLRHLHVDMSEHLKQRSDSRVHDVCLGHINAWLARVPINLLEKLEFNVYVPSMRIVLDMTQKDYMTRPALILKIANARKLTMGDIRQMFDNIFTNRPAVQRVDVASCPNIDEGELRALFADTEDVSYVL